MTGPDERLRVVVADDHPFFRDGVTRGLVATGEIEVVGEAGSGRDALTAIRELLPAVALVDHQMPDGDGIAVAEAVVRESVPTRVLLLSAATDSALVYRALEVGAAGYLSKESSRADIVAAVRRAARGETVLPADLAGALAAQIRVRSKRSAPVLTEREVQVLRAFARGRSVPQVAQELFLGASTVKTHAQHLYEKLGVGDRAAAVATAMRLGLLD